MDATKYSGMETMTKHNLTLFAKNQLFKTECVSRNSKHIANQEHCQPLRVVSHMPSGEEEKCHSDMHITPLETLVKKMSFANFTVP